MRCAMSILFMALTVAPARAQEWPVVSPDGRTTITISLRAGGRLSWSVQHAGAAVLEESPLGVRRHDQTFSDGLKLLDAGETANVDDRYATPLGKRRDHGVRGRERVLTFANTGGARLDVIVRAHDDGVAIRYRFPETDVVPRRVFEELTGFHVPDGSTGWMLPQQQMHRYGPAYEDFFLQVAAGTAAPLAMGWSFPALFKTPAGRWMLLTEAALDGSYAGAHLAPDAPGNVYRIAFPDPEEGLGVGEIHPLSPLPWTLPWRVVIVGDAALRILESDLVSDLSPASRVKDTSWIKPGRAAWSWWSKSESPRHAEDLNAFTDLAADMGWEYALVDANWNQMLSGTIDDVIAHARQKGVGLLFWYNSGGPHNDVTEAPRDRMHQRDLRRAEFARLKQWGVKGVKVDFWHSDKPDRIRQYRDVLEDAADFQLLVNFHGCTIPRGWSREFPNLVSMEAVFGAEQYKFRDAFPARAAWLNSVLPFTRNAIGSMDYTPVTFSDVRFPHLTTNAHELALAVVFESGVQHFADSVASYRALPPAPREFLSKVPAAWDETRGLSGEPGESVIVARRDGNAWYVGGLNAQDQPRTARVSLGFLAGAGWTMTLIRDGSTDRSFDNESRRVDAAAVIDVPMRALGGFVMRLTR